MKKNLFLLALLLILLGVTYLFQEKRSETEYNESLVKDLIITQEIVQLRLDGVLMTKDKEQWKTGDTLLSHNFMKQLEKKLKELKKVKDISGDWQSYFPKPFSIEVNGTAFTFGEMSLDQQSFYVGVDKKIMLAVIEGESTELTSDEKKIAGIKYNELLTLLNKDLPELKENQFFRFYPKLPLDKVQVQMEGNLEFELNFKTNTTTPAPIKGIEVHEKIQQKFLALLTQVTIKEELDYAQTPKFKQLGKMRFANEDKVQEWEVWLTKKSSADAVIFDHQNKKVFQMIGGSLKIFFTHVQDYWDKKIIAPSKFHSFDKMTLTFTQGSKSTPVQLINAQPLKFEAGQFKVNQDKMHILMSYLLNLSDKDQADRVSMLSPSERQQLLAESHLRVEILGEEVLFWNKAQELIVVNLTQGFKAHFSLGDKTMEFKFQDVLE